MRTRWVPVTLIAAAGLLVAGCGFRALISMTTWAELRCEGCQAKVARVGQPVEIGISWPCRGPEPTADEESRAQVAQICREPFQVLARCEGTPCEVKQELREGSRRLAIIPTAPGRLTVRVTIQDTLTEPRTEVFGPVEVVKLDRLELTCTSRAPTGGPRAPCAEGVPAGHGVSVEIAAFSGDRRIAGVTPEVRADGATMQPGVRVQGAPWVCAASVGAADGRGEVLRCAAYALPAGEHVVEAELSGLRGEARFQVAAP